MYMWSTRSRDTVSYTTLAIFAHILHFRDTQMTSAKAPAFTAQHRLTLES
jgi:hypothetical protein